MKVKESCGCTHNGARWLSECEPHRAENDALHARAMADLRQAEGHATKSPTASPMSDWLELPAETPSTRARRAKP